MRPLHHNIALKTICAALLIGSVGAGVFFAARRGLLPAELMRPELILWILVGCFLALVAFVLMHIIRPLQQITQQLEQMRTGEITEIIHDRPDELGRLTNFFNETVRAIQRVSEDINERKRMSDELVFTSNVQNKLLPRCMPDIPGMEVVVKTRSATEVGGDNFDFFEKEGNTLMYVGDATGHGFPAALVMSMVNVLVHAAAHTHDTPTEILASVNRAVQPKLLSTMFMTLVMLRYEHATSTLYFTGCGHEHILVYRAASGTCEAIKTGGIALGMVPDVTKMLTEKEIDLAEGDAVVLFTDGITEAMNADGDMFGVSRLTQAVASVGQKSSADYIFNAVSKAFDTFVGGSFSQSDDITLLVIKRVSAEPHLKLAIDTSGIEKSRAANWSWDS